MQVLQVARPVVVRREPAAREPAELARLRPRAVDRDAAAVAGAVAAVRRPAFR